MKSFKITDKYQLTVPKNIRNFLHLNKGDRATFKRENDKVVLNKFICIDYEYLNSLSSTLTEWSSLEDEEAYHDL